MSGEDYSTGEHVVDMYEPRDIPHIRFHKIPRLENITVVVTEKLDGTNGVVHVQSISSGDSDINPIYCPKQLRVGSHNKWLTEKDDNHGFYKFVRDNAEHFYKLKDGYHYGEFVGPGIQKNRYQLKEKHFYLFNTKEGAIPDDMGEFIHTVPIYGIEPLKMFLSENRYYLGDYLNCASLLSPGCKREGIMLYLVELGKYIKVIEDK